MDIFKALAEENRLRMVSLLLQRDMCISELVEGLGLRQSNVSYHASVLQNCRLLKSYRRGQRVFYAISMTFDRRHHKLKEYLEEKVKELPTFDEDVQRALAVRQTCKD